MLDFTILLLLLTSIILPTSTFGNVGQVSNSPGLTMTALFDSIKQFKTSELEGQWGFTKPNENKSELFASFTKNTGLIHIRSFYDIQKEFRVELQLIDGYHYQDKALEFTLQANENNSLSTENYSIYQVSPSEYEHSYRKNFMIQKKSYKLIIESHINDSSIPFLELTMKIFEECDSLDFPDAQLQDKCLNYQIKGILSLKPTANINYYIHSSFVTLILLIKFYATGKLISAPNNKVSRIMTLGTLVWDICIFRDYLYPLNDEYDSPLRPAFILLSSIIIILELSLCCVLAFDNCDQDESDGPPLSSLTSVPCLLGANLLIIMAFFIFFDLYNLRTFIILSLYLFPQIAKNSVTTFPDENFRLFIAYSIIPLVIIPYNNILCSSFGHFYHSSTNVLLFTFLVGIQLIIIYKQMKYGSEFLAPLMKFFRIKKVYENVNLELKNNVNSGQHDIEDQHERQECPICLSAYSEEPPCQLTERYLSTSLQRS